MVFVTTLKTNHRRDFSDELDQLLPAAVEFFTGALGVTARTMQFLKGNHGREFPQFLMAKTASGHAYIVEPDHPAPLVEVKAPAPHAPADSEPPNLSSRFDTVTEWRLGQMRKYYQQFTERQRQAGAATLVVPSIA